VIDWSAAARPGGRIGHAIEFHPEIGSTNDRALAALDEPGGEGRVILAELQHAGRGRRGRNWQSPTGLNLTFSVALRPRLAATDAGRLAMAAALAVRDACLPGARLAIRWPNDLVATDGRKVAGLLLETALLGDRISHVVIGMGINVNWRRAEMPLEIATSATSLADLGGADIDRVALLRRLLRSLENEIGELQQGRSPVARYRAASWLDGRRIVVSLGGHELEGVARGVDEHGALLLDTDQGRRVLSSGEVVRVRERAVAAA
jgi:BirA family transcriptional regulator, biotin operon repressor / biotin---[acetyl-CoA-carboxylase] ligase